MAKKTKNNFRQKSFVFKDYPNTELFLNKNNNQLIKVSLNRTSYLFFSYLILILIFSIKIFYLSLFPEKKIASQIIEKNFDKERRDIVDREGKIIASNINVYKAGIRPLFIKNKEKFLLKRY